MKKYIHIYYNEVDKTQRFVLTNGKACTATINHSLNKARISFTNHLFLGEYKSLIDYKSKTYKYAQKWQWLSTIDFSNKILKY